MSGIKNATYCYDANGNMTSGDGKMVSYTAFDMASLISKGGKSVAITYGPDRARYKRVDTGTTGTVTTLYIGGKAMERIDRGGVIETKHYIGDFAVVTTSGTTTQTSYLLRDHLGSVDVITDEAGAVLERMSFDAWGKRREVNWQAMADATAYVPLVTTRGFTGHEQLDPVGLVHMNGRVYDPELGRFLSADPFLQDVSNLQAWNRYSYVLNNPLSMTDPTGFFFGKIFKALGNFLKGAFKAISSIVKAVIKAIGNTPLLRAAIQAVACANPAAVFTCVPVAGALTLAAGGSITDALQAMAFSIASMGGAGLAQGLAGAVQGLTEMGSALLQSAGNGVVSGALSVAQGGSFLSGFAAGSIGTFSNLGGGVLTGNNEFMSNVISVAGGGIAAEVTGGKFVNGAATAAFAIAGRAMFDGAGSAVSVNEVQVEVLIEPAMSQNLPGQPGYTRTPLLQGPGGGRTAFYGGRAGDDAAKINAAVRDAVKSVIDFIVSPRGTAFPVPKGATGPVPVINQSGRQTGVAFTGGAGGANGQVDTLRLMYPTPPRGSSPGYPNGYVKYNNRLGQGVDPYTGRTLGNDRNHFLID